MTEGVQSALSVSQRNGMSTVPAVCLTGGYDIGELVGARSWWYLRLELCAALTGVSLSWWKKAVLPSYPRWFTILQTAVHITGTERP